jgi:tripartite-type tricarboxylate transporter receptor subunit TctC
MMTIRIARVVGALILGMALVLAACSSGSDQTATPADFYEGETIDLIVSDNAGSESDLLARVIASYLERDTGASVVVTNRRGAGGLDGVNYLYGSDADGLTLGVTSAFKFVANDVLDEPAAAYDIEEFSYIMVFGNEPLYLFVSPYGPYQAVSDLLGGENLKIGAGSPSGPISLGGLTVIELLDLDAKVVTGLSGDAARALATRRGEVVGYVSSMPTVKSSLESGLVKPLFALSTERNPLTPDVPAIAELVDLSDEDLDLVDLWETALVGGMRIFAAPPDVPQDRLAFLHDVVAGWIEDAEFRGEINAVTGYDVQEYAVGEAVAEVMLDLAAGLDGYRAKFAEMIERYRA